MKISTSAIGISLTLASQCFAQQASAQGVPSVSDSGDLGDIVATAQKREQSIQRVPVTITAITGESLAMRGTANIEDLGLTVPGVQIGMATGVIQPFLRGEGNTSTTIGL